MKKNKLVGFLHVASDLNVAYLYPFLLRSFMILLIFFASSTGRLMGKGSGPA